jgi:hypothetical protein
VTCSECSLEYSVYGVFAFCPDCGKHNSLQILQKNIDLVQKQLALAAVQPDAELKRHLIEDALENCVSAFDGFAREACRIQATRGSDAAKCTSLSFQNLPRAAKRLVSLFNIDMTHGISREDWNAAHVAFMRRHVLAHRGGVIDQQYLQETGVPGYFWGRRVSVTAGEVERLANTVLKIGQCLVNSLSFSRKQPDSPIT